MCKKMSSESDEQPSYDDMLNLADMTLEQQLTTLQEKLKRTTKFLHEIQTLSPACEEVNEEDVKEKQVFSRRIVQVGAELQDARDVIWGMCRPPRGLLSQRQLELVSSESALEDPVYDPSIRFFGLDWQQLYAKCFSLSLNVSRFRAQMVDVGSGGAIDLVLLSSILRSLGSIEVDVVSHGEAVLGGRLSKSQQMLIQQEQARVSLLAPAAETSSSTTKVGKSRSFRDTQQKKTRPLNRYRKNKTTDLNKLSASTSMTPISSATAAVAAEGSSFSSSSSSSSNVSSSPPAAACGHNHNNIIICSSCGDKWKQEETEVSSAAQNNAKRKTSFIQNVSSIFKNIR